MSYIFTQFWFDNQKPIIEKILQEVSGQRLRILEIGAFEGYSSAWYVDNLLSHPDSLIDIIDPFCESDSTTSVQSNTYSTFLSNMSKTKFSNKINIYKNFSQKVLPLLLIKESLYDFISIDGSHLKNDVLRDTIMCFDLLSPSGIMIFDDYGSPTAGVKEAVDAFLTCVDCIILHSQYHFVIQKLPI